MAALAELERSCHAEDSSADDTDLHGGTHRFWPALCIKGSQLVLLICSILFIIKYLLSYTTDIEGKLGPLFSNLLQQPVAAVFDSPQTSSDGVSVLPKPCDAALGLAETLALCLRDVRQPCKVVRGLRAWLR